MSKTLTLLAAATALTAVVGLPVWSAMGAPAQSGAMQAVPAVLDVRGVIDRLILVDDDEDENEGGEARSARRGSNEEGDDSEECDDDEGACGAAGNNPAPAGSVAPPANGLFGTGEPPKATVN